jgi:hypothetical protein
MLSARVWLGVAMAVLSVAASGGTASAVTSVPDRFTTIAAGRLGVDGAAGYGVRGTARIRTSDAVVRRTSPDGAPTARFTATVSDGCTAKLQVSLRGVASSNGPVTRARTIMRHAELILGAGRRAGGAWRLSEQLDSGTGERYLYGVAVVVLSRHRWVDVRSFAFFSRACSDVDRRAGAAAKSLGHLARTAQVRARVVAVPR